MAELGEAGCRHDADITHSEYADAHENPSMKWLGA
jgi:hypothetical protein